MTSQDVLTASDRDLFPSADEKAIKTMFRRLAAEWHPDHNSSPEASNVFAHLTAMKERALNRGQFPSVMFTRENGKSFRMEYLRTSMGQGYRVYVGVSSVAYHIAGNDDLARAAAQYRWKFANKDMEKEMNRFIAPMSRQEILSDGSRLMVYRRNPDQILMRDLIDLEGKIEPVHVTWMISRMINLVCYLEWAKLSHCALSPENLLVSLSEHSIAFSGPMLYSTPFGKRPSAVPSRTIKVANWLSNKTSVADSRIDLALVRETALDLLGDKGGARLLSNPAMKKEIINFILAPSAKTAIDDYKNWEIARGDRRFAVYDKTAQVIYDSAQ